MLCQRVAIYGIVVSGLNIPAHDFFHDLRNKNTILIIIEIPLLRLYGIALVKFGNPVRVLLSLAHIAIHRRLIIIKVIPRFHYLQSLIAAGRQTVTKQNNKPVGFFVVRVVHSGPVSVQHLPCFSQTGLGKRTRALPHTPNKAVRPRFNLFTVCKGKQIDCFYICGITEVYN